MSAATRGFHRRRIVIQRGSTLIEGLLAIVIFSVGLIGLLMLMASTLVTSADAHYRSEASLLASDLVARMWNGDRTLAGLQQRFGNADTAEHREWLQRVQAALPGAADASLAPQVSISAQREVTVRLNWQAPRDDAAHRLVVQTQITD
jgi:type IV pilus assembly protein PilV